MLENQTKNETVTNGKVTDTKKIETRNTRREYKKRQTRRSTTNTLKKESQERKANQLENVREENQIMRKDAPKRRRNYNSRKTR